eukprot:5388727-Prymnesium_polylepis.1
MAAGRPYGDAIDGAVSGSSAHHMRPRKLTAAPLPHVCTPPPRVRTSKTAADLKQLTASPRACGRRLVPAAHE